jgi:DNA-binding PadR family transcriptional regulator
MNMPAEKRCEKLLSIINTKDNYVSGITDRFAASYLDWEISSVRSTATQLQNKGYVYIVKDEDQEWKLFSDTELDQEEGQDSEEAEDAIYELGQDIANAIAKYVKSAKRN